MAVVGCYDLHLYCDTGGDIFGGDCPHRGYGKGPGEFTGRNEGEALARARLSGWSFAERNTKTFCPHCTRDKKDRRYVS